MENFFSLQHKLVFNRKDDVFGRFESICKVSSLNLVAYTSENELKDGEKGFHVYLFDLNTPWYSYKIATRKYPITALEWDQTSSFLLIADNYGKCTVFAQKNNLIDDWIEIQNINFPNENIITAKFFFNGVKYPKYQHDQVLYTDKYQKSRIQPAVRAFGSTACTGVIVITSTGLVGAFSFDINSSTPNSNGENYFVKNLGQGRNILTVADIAFKNGQFYIAAANSAQKSPIIQCYRVHIEKVDEELVINSKSLPSFFINESAAVKDLSELKLFKVKWMSQEDADALIISSNHLGGSIVEIWMLKEESLPIHKMFQTNKNECYKTLIWSNTQTYRHSRKVIDVVTTKVPFTTNFYMYIAYTDSTIHCLNREGLKRVNITNVNFSASALEHQTKIIKMTSKMAALDITFMGNLLFAIDSIGQVCCFKINFDHIMMNIIQAVNLLEYQMISGLDTLDSMLMLKPQMIDSIVDRMTENFNRQPNYITQFYYLKFMTMKINLYRMTQSGQNKAHDLICLLNLISISTAFKSLLRPTADLMTSKNGPAENLASELNWF
jgi:mediator of RNA polymerase II transcription subunit 16